MPIHAARKPASVLNTILAHASAMLLPLLAVTTYLARRAEIRHLATFDDHMLKDIGLTRADIDGALRDSIFTATPTLLVRSGERRARSVRVGDQARSRPVVSAVSATRAA